MGGEDDRDGSERACSIDFSASVDATLDAPVPLTFVSLFLTLRELCSVRAVNRNCFTMLPKHTRALVGTKLHHQNALTFATTYFPRVTKLALRDCRISGDALTCAIECISTQWTHLQELELSLVWHLKDHHVHQLTEQCASLETLTIAQCYRVQTPLLAAPQLRCLSIRRCFFTRFAPETRFPVLQELRIVSQAIKTLDVHHLIKDVLVKRSPDLKVLRLANCGNIEQVLIDPMELPMLVTLDLTSCQALNRVHVSSQSLTTVALSLCAELQCVILDLSSVSLVDLSFLKSLTQLFLRSESLKTLNLSACNQLERENLHVSCPALQVVLLHGTALSAEDITDKSVVVEE